MPALRLLSVHPHPDDESIACGGILARSVDEGIEVHVVTCTGGEEGENLAGIDLGGEDLVAHRRRELQDALAALGVRHHHLLGYRDSGMAGTPANEREDSFHRADLYVAALRVAGLIRRTRPHVVISDDEHGTYGHPDHIKAHRVTERAVAIAADPWWETPEDGEPWTVAKRYVHTLSRSRLLEAHRRLVEAGLPSPFGEEVPAAEDLPFGTDDDLVTTAVDIRAWLPRKREAMAAHRSQIGPDSLFLNTPDELATAIFGTEEFRLLASDVPTPTPETDLFSGLRATS